MPESVKISQSKYWSKGALTWTDSPPSSSSVLDKPPIPAKNSPNSKRLGTLIEFSHAGSGRTGAKMTAALSSSHSHLLWFPPPLPFLPFPLPLLHWEFRWAPRQNWQAWVLRFTHGSGQAPRAPLAKAKQIWLPSRSVWNSLRAFRGCPPSSFLAFWGSFYGAFHGTSGYLPPPAAFCFCLFRALLDSPSPGVRCIALDIASPYWDLSVSFLDICLPAPPRVRKVWAGRTTILSQYSCNLAA